MEPRHVISLAMLILLSTWLLLLRPNFLGGPASYIIVSGISMEPTMHTGDMALAIRQDSYETGDVIAFRVDEGETRGYRVPEGGGIVIHRIIDGSASEGFLTQGDNNNWIDPWKPTPDEITGKAVLYVPKLGALASYLQDPLRMSLAVGGIFLYISMAGFVLSYRRIGNRERRRRRREQIARRRAGIASRLDL